MSVESRRFPERPLVGVGAVVVGANGVLLVRRAHEPLKGQWSLPGGLVEIGEPLVRAVAREVLEETGLTVSVAAYLDTVEVIRHDADGRVEYHYVLLDYLCRPAAGTIRASSDAADACWVSPVYLSDYRLSDATMCVIAKGVDLVAQSPELLP